MRIHFIGIGGIGVSALAQYYLQKGHEVLGSDLAASEITEMLAKKGAKIMIGNKAEHIHPGIDLVIYSPAVKADNPELLKAKSYNLKAKSYPEALGELTRQYETIAISGSHGKSTTTAMTALILIKAGLDPTVIVGTKLREFSDSNFRMGKSKYLVIEACEYDGSFLEYSPKIAVITNVDKEHLDYFHTFANIIKAFRAFIVRLPSGGFLILNKDDAGNAKIKIQKSKLQFKIQNYSLRQLEAKKLKLKIPGKHNISNALAALTVARTLGIPDAISLKALAEFKGTWRRFEIFEKILPKPDSLKAKRYTLISDYGHHPTEVLATLNAAREKYPKKKIWLIFQPHQHQRTFYLLKDFVKIFKTIKIDHIFITDIYDVAGRETGNISKKIDSKTLVKKINKKNVYYATMTEARRQVKEKIEEGDVLIIMGAGDIYKLADNF